MIYLISNLRVALVNRNSRKVISVILVYFIPFQHEMRPNFLALLIFFFLWRCGPTCAMVSSFLRFLDHTQRRITVGRTPLDEWSARRRDLYLTTHNTQQRTDIHAPGGIRTQNLSRRAAVVLRLRPRSHRDRRTCLLTLIVLMWRIGWAHNDARK